MEWAIKILLLCAVSSLLVDGSAKAKKDSMHIISTQCKKSTEKTIESTFKERLFEYFCLERRQQGIPPKSETDPQEAIINYVLCIICIILVIVALLSVTNWYLRNQTEREKNREMIEYHLIKMRRSRYVKARADREASFQRREAKAQRKLKTQEAKAKKERDAQLRAAKKESSKNRVMKC